MPVFVRLCLSLFGCACLCYAVPVRIGLCLSLLRCAYPYWALPVFVTLCLSVLGCACLCYAVPNRVQLCWPLRVPLLFRNRILTLIPLYIFDPADNSLLSLLNRRRGEGEGERVEVTRYAIHSPSDSFLKQYFSSVDLLRRWTVV